MASDAKPTTQCVKRNEILSWPSGVFFCHIFGKFVLGSVLINKIDELNDLSYWQQIASN